MMAISPDITRKERIMKRMILLLSCCLWVAPQVSSAQQVPVKATKAKAKKIAWHGTWKGGLAEAQRTGKAILLLSAAPQCHSVPGIW
tara:strand:+ start:415 stop:675 length:261 start_codon:yes stop_codon:yes gene_type:complete